MTELTHAAEDDAAFVERLAPGWHNGDDDYVAIHENDWPRLISLARRATAPTPQREDRYRTGLLRAAEIVGRFSCGECGDMTVIIAAIRAEAEAASPPPDLTTPHVPVRPGRPRLRSCARLPPAGQRVTPNELRTYVENALEDEGDRTWADRLALDLRDALAALATAKLKGWEDAISAATKIVASHDRMYGGSFGDQLRALAPTTAKGDADV